MSTTPKIPVFPIESQNDAEDFQKLKNPRQMYNYNSYTCVIASKDAIPTQAITFAWQDVFNYFQKIAEEHKAIAILTRPASHSICKDGLNYLATIVQEAFLVIPE